MRSTLIINNKVIQLKEVLSFALVILLALMIRALVMELFFVPTASMKGTILENDYIFATKYSYGYSKYSFPFHPNIFSGRIFAMPPQRGDVVIFRPPNKMSIRYIKRLIGMPGDRVQLINDVIYINGHPIQRQEVGSYKSESGKIYKKFQETLPSGISYFAYKLYQQGAIVVNHYETTKIFHVPEGHYFFLGDNRDESNDSRIDLGYVPFENFIGKAHFIIFSTGETFWQNNTSIIDQILRVTTWLSSIRWNRLFTPLDIQ